MGNIYDNNEKSAHGPSGIDKPSERGPWGGKEKDNLSNKNAAKVIKQIHE